MAKLQKNNIIIETRIKHKHNVVDIKQIIKLLCVDNKGYPEIFATLKEKVSIRHIKIIAYILKYGNISNIRLMFVNDDHNPYKIKYMLARIKNIVKNVDRKETTKIKLTISEKFEIINTRSSKW